MPVGVKYHPGGDHLRVLQLGLLTERTPPKRYGAIGRILDALIDGLFDLGQEVDLLATGDSRTRANRLIGACPVPVQGSAGDLETAFEIVQMHAQEYDLVHNHNPYLAPLLEDLQGPTVVTTCHLEQPEIWKLLRRQQLVAISDDQARRLRPQTVCAVIPLVVRNAVYQQDFNLNRSDFVLLLAKIAPSKGVVEAIQAATQAGSRLVIAGPIYPEDRGYYQQYVAPLIDGNLVVYFGEAIEEERNSLLRQCHGLLFTSLFGEPFGLVMLEALVHGRGSPCLVNLPSGREVVLVCRKHSHVQPSTLFRDRVLALERPVIAFNRNAAPEVIQHGVNGYLAESVDDMADSIRRLHVIRPADCRSSILRFGPHEIAKMYLDLYRTLVGSKSDRLSHAGGGTVIIVEGRLDHDDKNTIVNRLTQPSSFSRILTTAVGASEQITCLTIKMANLEPDECLVCWDSSGLLPRVIRAATHCQKFLHIKLLEPERERVNDQAVLRTGQAREVYPVLVLSRELPVAQLADQIVGRLKIQV